MDNQTIKYPIYIVSKGRYKNPLTAKMFMRENIPFKMVIEPQEYGDYKTTIPENNILCTNFSNLGLGSFPARNFAWEDSINNGFDKHFLFDDNISGFYSYSRNLRKKIADVKKALLALQQLDSIFSNVGMSGFNYHYFGYGVIKPFRYNVHVYSALLVTNNIPFRWRMKYNEDVDLCLQILHNKLCTIQLNRYMAIKRSTVSKMKGGNQDELYKGNDPKKKLLKAKSLEAVWPQYVKTVVKYGRPHHQVSWKKYFKHPLIRANATA